MILLRAVVYGIDVLYASVGFRHQALRLGKPLTLFDALLDQLEVVHGVLHGLVPVPWPGYMRPEG